VRNNAQRQVDELNKQKESVGAHLAQISQLLGGTMPGLADVLKASPQPQPAVAPAPAPAPARAVTAGPAEAEPVPAAAAAPARHSAPPAAPEAAKASANGKPGEGEDEWWTE
jgi:hypothetical protein